MPDFTLRRLTPDHAGEDGVPSAVDRRLAADHVAIGP
jgi:hypothetical protein